MLRFFLEELEERKLFGADAGSRDDELAVVADFLAEWDVNVESEHGSLYQQISPRAPIGSSL